MKWGYPGCPTQGFQSPATSPGIQTHQSCKGQFSDQELCGFLVPSNLPQGHGAGAHARLAGPRDARGPANPAHAVSSHQPRSHGCSGICSYHDNTLSQGGGSNIYRSARIKKCGGTWSRGLKNTQHQREPRKSKGTASCNADTTQSRCFVDTGVSHKCRWGPPLASGGGEQVGQVMKWKHGLR